MKLFQNWLVSDIGATKQLFSKWKKKIISRDILTCSLDVKKEKKEKKDIFQSTIFWSKSIWV